MFAGIGDSQRMKWYSVRKQDTHIVILHQRRHGANDCLQWRAQVGGFLGDFYSHPDRSIRRL